MAEKVSASLRVSTWTGKYTWITRNRHQLCLKLQREKNNNRSSVTFFAFVCFFKIAFPPLNAAGGWRPLIQTCSLFAPTCTRWQWATASASRNTACKTCTAIKKSSRVTFAVEIPAAATDFFGFGLFCFHRQSLVHLPATADLPTGDRVVLTHRQWGRWGPQRHWTNTLCTSH